MVVHISQARGGRSDSPDPIWSLDDQQLSYSEQQHHTNHLVLKQKHVAGLNDSAHSGRVLCDVRAGGRRRTTAKRWTGRSSRKMHKDHYGVNMGVNGSHAKVQHRC